MCMVLQLNKCIVEGYYAKSTQAFQLFSISVLMCSSADQIQT